MARAIVDSGNEISSPWVLRADEKDRLSVTDVFDRDRRGVEDSDAIVVDVTHPSTGVGMEVMAAYYSRRRIVMVMKRGSAVSRMLLHMGGKEVIEFESDADLYSALRGLLESGHPLQRE